MKHNRKRTILNIAIVLCAVTFVTSGSILLINYIKGQKLQKELDVLQEEMDQATEDQKEFEDLNIDEEVLSEEIEEDAEPVTDEAVLQAFDAMQAINPDIIAWIKVDGTNINYPVLCSQTDNEYYLTHNYKGEYDTQGAIYIENVNSIDFSDFNTVLYGHSMLNGRMFRSLHYFGEDADFFNTYGDITIYLPNKTLKYKVFECAYMDNIHIFSKLDNSSEGSINSFISDLTNKYKVANIRNEYSITAQSKIITLSTCTVKDSVRIGVFAVLINEENAEN